MLWTRWRQFLNRHRIIIVFGTVAGIVFVSYRPLLGGYFISEDFVFLSWLLDNAQFLLRGERVWEWLFAGGTVFLRPVTQLFFLLNYWAWDTHATGYYAINIGLHALNAFLLYILVLRILHQRLGALMASVLFALHPIHAESVCWITDLVDVLATFFVLLSLVYFVLFRQRSSGLYYVIAITSFILASLTKESTLTLPIVFLAYDGLFTWHRLRWKLFRAQLPLWGVLPGYIGLRFLLFGKFGGYADQGFLRFGLELFVQYYSQALKPFGVNIDSLWILITLSMVLVVLFRRVPGLWLGIVWIVALLIPAGSANYVAPRLVYIPSVGLAIAQGAILGTLFRKASLVWRGIAIGVFGALACAYAWSLFLRVDDWAAVSRATRAVVEKTRALYPTFPSDARLYFIGIPEYLRGIDVYEGNFPFAFRVAYRDNPTLWVKSVDKFPIVTEQIEQTHFFEYRRREVTEHREVRQQLLARQKCSKVRLVAVEWNFSQETQGWEPWHHITDFGIHDHVLALRAEGNDPFLGGPEIEIPAIALAGIEITLRAQAQQPFLQGQVYWRVLGATDFSPHLYQTFNIIADGEWRTYDLPLASGLLSVEDKIIQLRLDPANAPAQLYIQSIRLLKHCVRLEGKYCRCDQ